MNKLCIRSGGVMMVALLCLCGVPIEVRGQNPEFSSRPVNEVSTKRKEPNWLRRPAADTPSEQFAHAEALRVSGKRRHAMKAYRNLVHAWHDSAEAPEAQRMYAQMLLEREDLHRAFEEYQYLIKFYAGKFPYEGVLETQFKIANLVRAENEKKAQFVGGSSFKALPLYEKVVKNAPNWERTPEAQFYIGAIYEGRKDYLSAIEAYEHVMLRYPKSAYLTDASFRRAHCLAALSAKNPRDAEQSSTALTAIVGFLRDYPSDPNADAARETRDVLKQRLADLYYAKAVFYDEVARKPEAALIAYSDFLTRFPMSEKAEDVQKRIETLQEHVEEEP